MDTKQIIDELTHLYNTYNDMHDELNEKVANHTQDVSQFWEINHVRANSMREQSLPKPHLSDPESKDMLDQFKELGMDVGDEKGKSKEDIEVSWLHSHVDEYYYTFRDATTEDIKEHMGIRANAYGFIAQCFIEIDLKVKDRYKKFLELKNKLINGIEDKSKIKFDLFDSLEAHIHKNMDENKWYISASVTSFRSCILFASKKGVKLDYSDNKNLIDKGFLKLLNDK